MNRYAKLFVLFSFFFFITSCSISSEDSEEQARRRARSQGDIVIGVAWPFSTTEHKLRPGIEMAQQEINGAGGVLGRQIELRWADDAGSAPQGRYEAQQFADQKDVIAVIGHYNSRVSIPASAIYQFANILMLSPGSTSPRLTQQGFDLVFRNIPTDDEIGCQLARFAYNQGYHSMLILAAKDTYGRGLANVFETEAGRLNIEIVDRLSYPKNSDETFFQSILERWKQLSFDAIFIAGTTPEPAYFIRLARKLGVQSPILGGDGLDSPQLWELGGEAAEGTIVATAFHPDVPRPELEQFTSAFQQKYGELPDAWAAQGYDALKLLAYAMEQAGATDPDAVANTLRETRNWPGVTGPHTFDLNGDVVGKPIVLQQVKGQQFVYLTETY